MIRRYDDPVNQRCKLPPYLDGTEIYSDQIHSLNRRLRVLDTATSLVSVTAIVLIFLEVS